MANGQYPQQSGGGRGSTTYAPEAPPVSRATGGCGCRSTASPPPATCCDITCFERPRAFCGHLLTDADLSLDQRYVIEKQKLYHRALHGSGIVCGLRLTCDPDCCGHVMIDEGFGIDDCGNDLVVCVPTSFNVVGRLREKKLLLANPVRDDCKPDDPPEDCIIRQCFYVVACYEEQPREYQTPLTPGCGPSLTDCEPTRIAETVRFDVLDTLPARRSPIDELEARIEHCFKLFTEGRFAEELKSDLVSAALGGGANPGGYTELCDAFCRLRALLGLYLDAHPDRYNCRMRADVAAVKCPADPGNAASDQQRKNYASDFQTAFCRLVDLAYAHVMSCVMGELAVPCTEPAEASCLVLGTVEVENDCVVRVCNCPRTYVWSFASFFQVLMATLLGQEACETKPSNVIGPKPHGSPGYHVLDRGASGGTCCAEFKPRDGCAALVSRLRQSGAAAADVATATLQAVRTVSRALNYALDPMRTDALQLRSLVGLKTEEASAILRELQLNAAYEEAPDNPVPDNPLDELSAQFHFSEADVRSGKIQLVVRQRAGLVVDVGQQTFEDRLRRIESRLAELSSGSKPTPSRPGPGARSSRGGRP